MIYNSLLSYSYYTVLLTKITATQNEVALSYYKVRGLCFLTVIFWATLLNHGLISGTNFSRRKNNCQKM